MLFEFMNGAFDLQTQAQFTILSYLQQLVLRTILTGI